MSAGHDELPSHLDKHVGAAHTLDSSRRYKWNPITWPRKRLAVTVYLGLALLPAVVLAHDDRLVFGLLSLVPALLGIWGIVISAILLRLAYVGTRLSDPMAVVDAARERVLDGMSPYGIGYAESYPPGAPYPYGPLMLLNSIPLEFVASVGILVLLAWHRRYLTLAIFGGAGFTVALAGAGHTDMLPTFVLAAGILSLPRWWGAALIGVAMAIKPYVVFFLPLAFSLGSPMLFVIAIGVAAAGYLPLFWWGGFVDSLVLLAAIKESTIPTPLRAFSVIAVGAFRWPIFACVAYALAAFNPVGHDAHHLVPLIVVSGLLVESDRGRALARTLRDGSAFSSQAQDRPQSRQAS